MMKGESVLLQEKQHPTATEMEIKLQIQKKVILPIQVTLLQLHVILLIQIPM